MRPVEFLDQFHEGFSIVIKTLHLQAITEVETRMEQLSVEKAKYDAQKKVLLVKVQEDTKDLQVEKEAMQTDLVAQKEVVNKAQSEVKQQFF